MRLHLVEIHDLAWCPASLRDALTDFLAFALRVGRTYAPAAPLLREAVRRTGATRVVDLCAGAGGPWSWLRADVGVPVVLTDLFPHRSAALYHVPVDARAVPPGLKGFRTLFTSFHHFRPAEARAILADAVRDGQGIAIFEAARRRPLDLLLVAFTWLGVLLATPFMRPFRWSRLLWTYFPPVLPVVGTFDGLVSCLRWYSPRELRALVAGFDGYEWDIGTVRDPRSPLHMAYLIGVPRAVAS
ncbi:MAG: class I SAM-dependent methyltransferase [Gemmatimonadales bacterium]